MVMSGLPPQTIFIPAALTRKLLLLRETVCQVLRFADVAREGSGRANRFAWRRIYTDGVPMSENTTRDTVILGSGCSGLTAAIYAARSNLKPLVLEGHEPGGQLSITTLVENFPGFPEGIQGPELIENMKKQAERFGAVLQLAHLDRVALGVRPLRLPT